MPELSRSSRYRTRSQDPVGEEERARLTAQLNDAYAEGALDDDAYRQHLDRVFGARTLGELAPVVEQLGKPATYAEPELVRQSAGRPGEVTPARTPKPALVLGVAGAAVALVLVILLLIILI